MTKSEIMFYLGIGCIVLSIVLLVRMIVIGKLKKSDISRNIEEREQLIKSEFSNKVANATGIHNRETKLQNDLKVAVDEETVYVKMYQ